jgi:CHASE3 domain sensor protein
MASFGFAGVLIVLSIVAVWGEFSTNRTAQAAKRFNQLSDAFDQARFELAAEESLNRKYRLQPSAEVLDRHHEAAASMLLHDTYFDLRAGARHQQSAARSDEGRCLAP